MNVAVTDPLAFACRFCGSSAGDQCKTARGKNKATCKGRGTLTEAVPAKPDPPPVAPAKADDFDEATPPPKGRPIGVPVKRYLTLPPGEDVVEQFREWDRDGRIPAGSILCRYRPPYCSEPYTVEWAAGGVPKPQNLDGFQVHICIVARPRTSANWVVMIPAANRRKS